MRTCSEPNTQQTLNLCTTTKSITMLLIIITILTVHLIIINPLNKALRTHNTTLEDVIKSFKPINITPLLNGSNRFSLFIDRVQLFTLLTDNVYTRKPLEVILNFIYSFKLFNCLPCHVFWWSIITSSILYNILLLITFNCQITVHIWWFILLQYSLMNYLHIKIKLNIFNKNDKKDI